jgi:arsenate reductase
MTGTLPLRILFLCTHNSARSQMAEAILRELGGGRIEAASAGTEVTRVHPLAVRELAAGAVPATYDKSCLLSCYAGCSAVGCTDTCPPSIIRTGCFC